MISKRVCGRCSFSLKTIRQWEQNGISVTTALSKYEVLCPFSIDMDYVGSGVPAWRRHVLDTTKDDIPFQCIMRLEQLVSNQEVGDV